MLRWAVLFLIISMIAAVFGFTDAAAASATIAKVIFFVFAIACLIAVVLAVVIGNSLRPKS